MMTNTASGAERCLLHILGENGKSKSVCATRLCLTGVSRMNPSRWGRVGRRGCSLLLSDSGSLEQRTGRWMCGDGGSGKREREESASLCSFLCCSHPLLQ